MSIAYAKIVDVNDSCNENTHKKNGQTQLSTLLLLLWTLRYLKFKITIRCLNLDSVTVFISVSRIR